MGVQLAQLGYSGASMGHLDGLDRRRHGVRAPREARGGGHDISGDDPVTISSALTACAAWSGCGAWLCERTCLERGDASSRRSLTRAVHYFAGHFRL